MSRDIPLARIIFILSCGVVAISFSSIFTKLCMAPALTIAFYRLGIASLFYFVLARKDGSFKNVLSRHHLLWAASSGLALALHFATWISSLSYTSVSSSTVLVVTSPVWVALGSAVFLREKTPWLMGFGIVLTIAGSIIISGADFVLDPDALVGNLLAVAGAIFAAVYLIIGRKLRVDLTTFQYVTLVYGAAALITLLFIGIFRLPLLGFSTTTWVLLFGIALLPQIVGHTSLNWALKYFSATAVAIISLGEPVGASLLAWLLLGQRIGLLQLVGGVVIVLGVAQAIYAEAHRSRQIKMMVE